MLIFTLIIGWVFGYPPIYENFWRARIWQNPQIPPKIQEAEAAAERQSPDALLIQTNLTGTVAAIQDDPDSPDANWLTYITNNVDTVTRVSFPTPTGNPTVGADLQQFKIWVRKQPGTGNPTVSISLYENGALVAEIMAATSVTSLTGQLFSATWNASLLGTADGSLVECYIFGGAVGGAPATRATVEVGAVEWNVDYTPSTTFLIGGTETGTKDTAVGTITFPEGSPETTVSVPYNDVDTSSDPQVLSPIASEPVVKIKNTHASATYNIILEITTWTNSLVNMEYYNLATDGATDIDAATTTLSAADGGANTVSTGVSITAGAYKDLYLKLTLSAVAGKTGTSTLSVLGEAP